MADDWDLYAVVRGCCSATATSTSSSSATRSAFLSLDDPFLSLPDPLETRRTDRIEDLQELLRPYFPKTQSRVSISPLSVLRGLQELSPPQKVAQPPPSQQQRKPSVCPAAGASADTTTPSPRSRKRKIQMKRVCEVAAEDLSSDTWSWRKYGQKPIKGSPYPRGYYKCSTLKGCLARKQVERNRSEPGMFTVTYSGDHNHPMPTHRNSLAGITRQKPEVPSAAAGKPDDKPSCSSPATTAERGENGEEREAFMAPVDEEEDDFGGSDMAVSDDFFEGLEEFTGDCLSDHFPTSLTGH